MRDVVVVGGGPAGAAAATFLAQAGRDVLVLDRARFPRPKPCAEYLSPEAARLLDAMGVLGAVESAGAMRLLGMSVRSPRGDTLRGEFARVAGWRGYRDHGLALPRTVLDPILLDAARRAGARVEEGARVIELLRDPAGRVTGVRVLRGERAGEADVPARLVIGADGLRTVVGRRLGLVRTARSPRRVALVAHWRGVEGMSAYGEMFVERGGYAGFASVGEDLTNVAVVVPARDAARIAGEPARYAREWLASKPHLAARIARAEPVDATLATGPFASRAYPAWAPGAALVGDAADFFDPFTGEGIYAALRGAELLAESLNGGGVLASTRDTDRALADYESRRRREFGGKWLVERIVGAAVGSPTAIGWAARAMARRPELADLMVGVTGDFVPAREVLSVGFARRLVGAALWARQATTREM